MKKGKQPEASKNAGARVKVDEKPAKSAEATAKSQVPVDPHIEQPERKSYRKREVVSNWDRYESHDPDISSDQEQQQQQITGTAKKVSTNFNLDFNELLRDSYDVSRGVIKTDRELAEPEDKLGDFLLLDKLKLERAFNCLTLAESASYDQRDDEAIETADFFDADELKLLDDEAKRAAEDFNRIYNKPAGSASGPKFIEIQEEFDFLKDLSLKEPEGAAQGEAAATASTVNSAEPKAGADWLDDLLN